MTRRQLRRFITLAEEIEATETMTQTDVALFPHLPGEIRGRIIGRLKTQARIPAFAGLRRVKPDQMRGLSRGKPKGRA
jgi:hypothetical protein